MKRKQRLVTGGCGFIGSKFLSYLEKNFPDDLVVNLDLLTYAGKPENLKGLALKHYVFVQGDIADPNVVNRLFDEYQFDEVIHFAAETHVDNSIRQPDIFIRTNVQGTFTLLEAARRCWQQKATSVSSPRFLHVSTDEVYGSTETGAFIESSPLNPSSPYSASKAASDLLARAYFITYDLPVMISRCSNNYGHQQYPEKFIPLMIRNAREGKKLPIYGDGMNVRDWIYVMDHCEALGILLQRGVPGEIYNIGAGNEQHNLNVARFILKELNKPESLLEFVPDRLGHDRRYAIDSSKIQRELGWHPKADFFSYLRDVIHGPHA